MKRIASIALAGILALALPGAALAADSSESVTILPSQTFTGVPASLVYGNGGVNAGTNADAPQFVIVSGTSDNPNGYKVEASFLTMTKTGDATKTIPTTAHRIKITGPLQANTSVTSPFTLGSYGNWSAASGVLAGLWSSTTAQATADSVAVDLRLVTNGIVPGSYTGTATFTFTLKP